MPAGICAARDSCLAPLEHPAPPLPQPLQAAIAAVTERKNEEIAQLQRQLREVQHGAEQQRAAAAAEAAASAAAELASLRHQLDEARRMAHVSLQPVCLYFDRGPRLWRMGAVRHSIALGSTSRAALVRNRSSA